MALFWLQETPGNHIVAADRVDDPGRVYNKIAVKLFTMARSSSGPAMPVSVLFAVRKLGGLAEWLRPPPGRPT